MINLFNYQTINVLQLSLGFFLVLFAFTSQSFIEETVIDSYAARGNFNKHVGYISLAVIYAIDTIGNFFAPSIIRILSVRWAFVLAVAAYATFQIGFLFLNEIYLLISSAFVGFGATIFWTAQGKYLTLNSTKETAGLHSGIFWASAQGCLAFGGVFLYVVFRDSNEDDDISESTTRIIYGVFSSVTLIALVILGTLRLKREEESLEKVGANKNEDDEDDLLPAEMFTSTFKLMLDKRMRLLILPFMFTGIELSFWSGIYPTCISFTKKLGSNTNTLLAFNAMAQGAGQVISGLFFGLLNSNSRKLKRETIVLLGATIHILVFIAVYINFPQNAPLDKTEDEGLIYPNIAIALTCGFFLAFADACWNTQIFSFLITYFPNQGSQAFALNLFFENLMTSAAFFYGTSFKLKYHLIILSIGAILGCISFVMAEKVQDRSVEQSDKQVSKLEF